MFKKLIVCTCFALGSMKNIISENMYEKLENILIPVNNWKDIDQLIKNKENIKNYFIQLIKNSDTKIPYDQTDDCYSYCSRVKFKLLDFKTEYQNKEDNIVNFINERFNSVLKENKNQLKLSLLTF